MLQLTKLTLVSRTAAETFAAEIPFYPGLNVVMAPNSGGKSTCLQAIIYALGLERMLGPRLEVPLPYAMREKIHALPDTPYATVIESFVELTIQNATAHVRIRRDIIGGSDRKLVRATLVSGASKEFAAGPERDFYLHDAGSAKRDAGFHRFLAEFIGWKLPMVTQFDGGEVPLYLEVIFPMMFVEQKRGWSAIQGPLPTMFSIQDVNRRVLEFLLDLQVGHVRRKHAELRTVVAQLQQRWKDLRKEAIERAGPGMRVAALQEEPTREFVDDPKLSIETFSDQEWILLEADLSETREELDRLEAQELPETEAVAADMERELAERRASLENLTAGMEVLRQEWMASRDDTQAITLRIATLQTDLSRNQDAKKLRKLGSVLGSASDDHKCPTCHQDLDAELLPTVPVRAMALEENINFIKSQLELYTASLSASRNQQTDIDRRYAAVTSDATEARQRIRELRQSLIQPSSSKSRTLIERMVRLQSRIDRLTLARGNVDALTDEAQSVARHLLRAREALSSLKHQDIGSDDKSKLEMFLKLIQVQCKQYGFKSYSPSEIELSDDNFRPIREVEEDGEVRQKELGFELSASDGIRLKWAYYLALMAVAVPPRGEHLSLAIFDEPGQQAMEAESLREFFRCAASVGRKGQVIAAITTEKAASFIDELEAGGAYVKRFGGLVLQPISSAGPPDAGVFA
ncbi:hypothetical protein [Methylobacterium goesingense]|uniref:Nucleic acid-binding Zn-ribbon protein n=1 Tax=Methylobacterium goesingense TaxID=243690 RepID=A0ABV2LAG7_9HYPH|nr:hypothetical protein [Methylobacterium goesingense]GJD75374.1 hypothetical protein CFIICLFH_3615 [Methylobacterium goesingense]